MAGAELPKDMRPLVLEQDRVGFEGRGQQHLINNRQAGRRRGRGGQRSQGGNPGRGPENGNRIDNRARGNAAQLHEKYKTLARDAQMQGDRVNTEYYLQFADHYFRVLAETRSRFEENQPRRGQNDQYDDGDEDDFDGGEPMAEDRVDQYAGERQDRGNGDRNNGDRNNERGNGREGGREGGRDAGRDAGRDGNRDARDGFQENGRDGGRDRNRPAPRTNGNGYAGDGQANGNRQPIQRDATADRAPDRQPRRDEGFGADASEDRAPAAAAPEADRPRRGRPRRVTPAPDRPTDRFDDDNHDAGEIAAIVDRLPPALSLSASNAPEAEEKPRRRRGRPPATEVTPVG